MKTFKSLCAFSTSELKEKHDMYARMYARFDKILTIQSALALFATLCWFVVVAKHTSSAELSSARVLLIICWILPIITAIFAVYSSLRSTFYNHASILYEDIRACNNELDKLCHRQENESR